MDSDPRTSTTINPTLLIDYAESRLRNPSGKTFALIKSTNHPTLPLAIHNYTPESLYRNSWDPLTIAARTLVTETTTGAVVSRSFSKFFNHHERHAYKPTGNEYRAIIEEKIDGSIASLFWYGGEWRLISKSQFDGPHVRMGREILDEMYPGATDKLDKEKTYIFEIVHPDSPMGVRYDTKDMFLLSIIEKDGREPVPDFDWSMFPFPRPKIHDARTIDLVELRRMNPINEEGFVVKFWATADDVRPQRVKVKFDSYLELIKSKHHVSPSGIVELYIKSRTGIHSLDEEIVTNRMKKLRDNYIRSLQGVADDFGGEPWIQKIEEIWDRVDALFVEKEWGWKRTMEKLQADGFTEVGNKDRDVKNAFAQRILKDDVEVALRSVLFMWYSGGSEEKQISTFARKVEIPKDLKEEKALGTRQWRAKEEQDEA